MRPVVVTGMGIISPIGNSAPEFYEGLNEGRSGMRPLHAPAAQTFPVADGFSVSNFDPQRFGVQDRDPFIQYAAAAAEEAVTDSGLNFKKLDRERLAVSVSSSKGGMTTLARLRQSFGPGLNPEAAALFQENLFPNQAAQWIARRWGARGPAKCYIAACATGTVSVIEGVKMVQDGTADVCLAGASDASLVPLMLHGYHRMKVLSRGGMRPFDRRREGFLVGEGAGILVLEAKEHARARGAGVYGEIAGTCYGNDPSHPLQFDLEGDALGRTLRNLLQKSRLGADEIDYMNLHGTGTAAGDLYETKQIKQALGKAAYGIPMSSTKSMTGHMLGASGAVEVIACLLALRHQFIPPTVGLEEADTACDLDYTPGRSKTARVRHALSLSMGFGGHIAGIVMKGTES